MKNALAPVVLFVYNRPRHTKNTLEALKCNSLASASELFVFSDAPRNAEAAGKVSQVRELLKNVQGFKKVTIVERETNWGLANSVIDGVTSILKKFPDVIVLEDDLITSANFLEYMNAGLAKYRGNRDVFSLSGYSHSNDEEGFPNTYFLKLVSSWGWATWADKWKTFRRDDQILKKILEDSELLPKFNYDNSFDYASMARLQLKRKIDSWAIYWHASVFLEDGLTLYPCKSLVQNIGFDGSGVHCGNQEGSGKKLTELNFILTEEIVETTENRKKIGRLLASSRPVFSDKIGLLIKRAIKAVLPAALIFHFNFLVAKLKLLAFRKRVGRGTFIDKTVNVFGWKNVSVGCNSVIGEGSWLNVNDRIEGLDQIQIGDNCYIGRRNLFSSGRQLIIGHYVMTSNECKFLGNNHVFENPMQPYVSTGTTSGGTMKIGVNTWLGAGATVLGSITIGHGSVIGAGSVVTKNIPPFSVAVGNPCRIVKRFNFRDNCWVGASDNDLIAGLEKLMPTEEEYLAALRKNCPQPPMPVLAATSRTGDLP